MYNFIAGVILGSVLTASLGVAGQFYNKQGEPSAPAGSIQQFDYFRQRQFYLDQSAIRRQIDNDRLQQLLKPCVR